jgi:hypothetical protein
MRYAQHPFMAKCEDLRTLTPLIKLVRQEKAKAT